VYIGGEDNLQHSRKDKGKYQDLPDRCDFFFFVAIGFGLRASCLLSRSLIQESENIQTVELFRNNFNDFLYHTLNYLKIGIFQSAEIIAQCCPVT
jgi:hypothetical protein